MTQGWSVDLGGVSVVRRQNRVGTGSASVTVHGARMGLFAFTVRGQDGQTGCEAADWGSESSVSCLATHGARVTCRVVITAGERGGSVTEGWSVDLGGVSMVRLQNQAGTGSASVTVHGASMGLDGLTAMVRSGETGCEGTEWESETSVRCKVGHGAWGTRRVVMTEEERPGRLSAV